MANNPNNIRDLNVFSSIPTTYDNRYYLVEITVDQLKALGMTTNQIGQLKANKEAREKQALAIMQQSGVPFDRLPKKFNEDMYYLEKDFTEDLAPFAQPAFENGIPVKGTGAYTGENSDGTVTSYPFNVGEFIPKTNNSPLQKVVEVLVDDGGIPQFTQQNKDDLTDMVRYLTSVANYNKLAMNVDSHRSPYINGKKRTIAEYQATPELDQYIQDVTNKQADLLEEFLLSLGTSFKRSSLFINLYGIDNPRKKNAAGVALDEKGGESSPFHKYNNVMIISLTESAAESLENRESEVNYEYGQGPGTKNQDGSISYQGENMSASEVYEKFYKDTKATTSIPVSGVNVQVVFEFPTNSAHKSVYLYMPDMITVSHSVHRTKIPVTTLGETTVTGIALGTKMVAGSIIKLFSRRDPFHNYIKLFVAERYAAMSRHRKASLLTLRQNISMNEVSDWMRDDIAPFNIHLFSFSEHDCVYDDPPKVDSIMGCTILNTGKVFSVENLITEETLSFMAKTVIYQDDMSGMVVQTNPSDSVTTGTALLYNVKEAPVWR